MIGCQEPSFPMFDLQRPRLAQFQTDIARAIPCVPEEARANLTKMVLPDSLRVFMNWRDQFVPMRLRQVQMSERFLRDPRTIQYWPAVEDLKSRIEAGEDLRPFFSNYIAQYGYVPPKTRKARKRRGINWEEKDHALNSYDAHHLHLSPTRQTEELLFVSFTRQSASFIMVGDHKSWKDGTLAIAVAEERAASGLELKGIFASPSEEFTVEQRTQLQWRGMSTEISVGDKIVPSAFVCGDGTGLAQSRHVDHMIMTLAKVDPSLDDDAYVRPLFESVGRPCPPDPEFFWLMRDCDLCVAEKSSRTAFSLLPWRR